MNVFLIWHRESTLGKLSSFNSVDEAKIFIEQLNLKNKHLTYQLDQIKQDYDAVKKAFTLVENQNKETEKKMVVLTEKLNTALDQAAHHTALIQILRTEKDHVTQLLDTYAAEEEIQDRGKETSSATSKRIQELERANKEKDDLYMDLLKEVEELRAEKVAIVEENQQLDRENQRIGKDLGTLQNRLGRGDYDPNTTKILHFIDNPAKRARQNLQLNFEAVVKQKKELEDKVIVLEQSLATAAASASSEISGPKGIIMTSTTWEKERGRYEEQLKLCQQKILAIEKSKKRFHEVFDRKFVEFKKAMRQIFGYRIDLLGDKANLYRLHPAHVSKENFFLLEYDGHTDSISLMDTPYMASWTKELEFYLGECHSYPAFLSAITLENLKKRQGS